MKYTTLSLLISLCLASNCCAQGHPMLNNPYQGLNQSMSSFYNSASNINGNTGYSTGYNTETLTQHNMGNETVYSMREQNKLIHTSTYFKMRQINQYYQELERIQRRAIHNRSQPMTIDQLNNLYRFNSPYGY